LVSPAIAQHGRAFLRGRSASPDIPPRSTAWVGSRGPLAVSGVSLFPHCRPFRALLLPSSFATSIISAISTTSAPGTTQVLFVTWGWKSFRPAYTYADTPVFCQTQTYVTAGPPLPLFRLSESEPLAPPPPSHHRLPLLNLQELKTEWHTTPPPRTRSPLTWNFYRSSPTR